VMILEINECFIEFLTAKGGSKNHFSSCCSCSLVSSFFGVIWSHNNIAVKGEEKSVKQTAMLLLNSNVVKREGEPDQTLRGHSWSTGEAF
jgi:hypothetical protein